MDDKTDARVRALTDALVARYPGRFSDDEVEQLRKQIDQIRQAAEKLRSFPLTNADEPEPIFQAVPRED
jgi:Asp-tRNA(Asn)/Glu-tRNA(Gln) amidotransferase C subunit